MRYKVGFIVFFLFIINFSCEKSVFNRHAKGIVTDISDGATIPFAEVKIVNYQVEFLGNSGYDILATGKADANGVFELIYKTDYEGTNYIWADAEHYYTMFETDKPEVNISSRKNLAVTLTPKTSVLINFNITDSNISYVYFSFESGIPYSYDAHRGVSQAHFDVVGNELNKYFYIIYYNNSQTSKIDGSVFCPKWNQTTATVNIKI